MQWVQLYKLVNPSTIHPNSNITLTRLLWWEQIYLMREEMRNIKWGHRMQWITSNSILIKWIIFNQIFKTALNKDSQWLIKKDCLQVIRLLFRDLIKVCSTVNLLLAWEQQVKVVICQKPLITKTKVILVQVKALIRFNL